jgi:hypothetical protein
MDELFDVVSNRGFLEPYSHIEIFHDPNSQYRFQGDIRTVRHSINLGARRDEAWRDSDVACWSRCCSPPPGRTTDKEKALSLSVSRIYRALLRHGAVASSMTTLCATVSN